MDSNLPLEVNRLFSSLTIKIVFLVIGLPILREIIRGFKSPKQKGKRGEGLVNFSMKLHLDSTVYHLIPDVTLLAGSGTTQIDHIVVSVYGVFVIETKIINM